MLHRLKRFRHNITINKLTNQSYGDVQGKREKH